MSFKPFRNWWMLALKGALLVIFGIYTLMNPGVALAVLVFYLGIVALASGVLEIVLSFARSADRSSYLVDGLIDVAIGVLLLWKPEVLGLTPILLGVWVALSGIALLVRSLRQRAAGDRSWVSWLILSVVLIVLGAQLIFDPSGSLMAVTWILGIVFLLLGGLVLALAFKVRKLGARIAGAVKDAQELS